MLRWFKIGAEKSYENKIKAYLKEKGCYQVKIHPDKFTKSGIPDLLINVNGFFIGAEVKVEHNPTELQLCNLRDIINSGGIAFIIAPGDEHQRLYRFIAKRYPGYTDTKIIDFGKFKKLVEFLLKYEPIGKDVVL